MRVHVRERRQQDSTAAIDAVDAVRRTDTRRDLGDVTGASGWALSTITVVPSVVSLAAMIVIGRHSDRTEGRLVWYGRLAQ